MARPNRASKTRAIERLSNLSDAINAHVDDDDDLLVTGPELIDVDDSGGEVVGVHDETYQSIPAGQKKRRSATALDLPVATEEVCEDTGSATKKRKKNKQKQTRQRKNTKGPQLRGLVTWRVMSFLPPQDQLHMAIACELDMWPAQPAIPHTLYVRESDRAQIIPKTDLALKVKKVVLILDASLNYLQSYDPKNLRSVSNSIRDSLKAVYDACKSLEWLKLKPTVTAWQQGWIDGKWQALHRAITKGAPPKLTLEMPIELHDHSDWRKTALNLSTIELMDEFLVGCETESVEWLVHPRSEPELCAAVDMYTVGRPEIFKSRSERRLIINVFFIESAYGTRPIDDVPALENWIKKFFATRPFPEAIEYGIGACAIECGPRKAASHYLAVDLSTKQLVSVAALSNVLDTHFDSICFGPTQDLISAPEKLAEIAYTIHSSDSRRAPLAGPAITTPSIETVATEVAILPGASTGSVDARICHLETLPVECLHNIASFLGRDALQRLATTSRCLSASLSSILMFHPQIHQSELIFAWPNTTTATWRAARSLTIVADIQHVHSNVLSRTTDGNMLWRTRLAWATAEFGTRLYDHIAGLPELRTISLRHPSYLHLPSADFSKLGRSLLSLCRKRLDLEVEWPIVLRWDDDRGTLMLYHYPWPTALTEQTMAQRFRFNVTVLPLGDLVADDRGSFESAATRIAVEVKQSFARLLLQNLKAKVSAQQVNVIRIRTHFRSGKLNSILNETDYSLNHNRRRSGGGGPVTRYAQYLELDCRTLRFVRDVTLSAWPHCDVYLADDDREPDHESRHCHGRRATFV